MWLVKLSIERPVLILMFECFLMVLGIMGYLRIGVDQYPEIDPPVVTVTTEYPGAGPEEIETLVSKKIEEEVNQIGGIERLVSTSMENISQVVVEFKLEIDAKEAMTEVRDKVARIRSDLPEQVEEPLIQRIDFDDAPILQLALTSEGSDPLSESALRNLAENVVKPKLQQIDGVGQVNTFGGLEREILIELDRQKLLLWKLTPKEVSDAIARANINVPAGALEEQPTSRSIRVIGEFATVGSIADVLVKSLDGGRLIQVRDLGQVKDTYMKRDSYARLNGSAVVLLEVKKQSDGNTVAVSNALFESLDKVNQILPTGATVSPLFDGSKRIKLAVADVIETLVIAAILAIVVVYFFLGSLQSTFITGMALPTSIIITMFALYVFGFTLNIMTLLGLTLCVGLILDDAIVVRENIWEKIEKGFSPKEAALEGTKEVYTAVMATSLTILATFLPVTLIPGVVGRFFSAFALTVCLSVVLSTFDAITMAPMMSAYMMTKKSRQTGHHQKVWIIRQTEKFGDYFAAMYESIITWSLLRPKTVLASAAAVFFMTIFSVKFIGFSFLPDSEYGEIEISIEAPPGTTVERTSMLAEEVERVASSYDFVKLVSTRVGSDMKETNIASIYIELVPYAMRDISTSEAKQIFRDRLVNLAFSESLNLGVGDAGGGGGGGRKPVSLALQGADTEQLRLLSLKVIERANESLPQVQNLETNLKAGRTELRYAVDPARASAFGLDTTQVGNALRGMYEGFISGQFRELGEEFDIRVRLRDSDRLGVATLASLTVPNIRDEMIPMSVVTRKETGSSPTKIVRLDQSRAAIVEGDLAPGAPLGDVIQKLTAIVQPMVPEGYSFEFQGQAKSLKDLGVGAVIALTLGALFIYMIMASLYNSFVIPFSILLTLPLAVVGALLSLLLSQNNLDIYSIIGIILLMGLVTKNAILLVDYVEQLRGQGKPRMEALKEGSIRRLRPIMMTTVAMIAGMLPIAIGYGELNKQRAGMGIASIGGLISSTLLSLVVVPCAYIYLDRFREWSKKIVSKYY